MITKVILFYNMKNNFAKSFFFLSFVLKLFNQIKSKFTKKFNAIVAVLAIVFVTLWSCNKDKELVQTNQNIDQTEQKILSFKSKIENPENTKSGETISLDSAVWYIEALLNYSYCIVSEDNAELACDINIVDSIFIQQTETDRINLQTVIQHYYSFEKKMLSALKKIDYTNKFLYLADIEFKNNTLILQYFIRGKNENKDFPIHYPYVITDNWIWGRNKGNCSGTILGQDAADQSNKWLAMNRAIKANTYYTEPIFTGAFAYIPQGYEFQDIIARNYEITTYPAMFQANLEGTIPPYNIDYCIHASMLNSTSKGANNAITIAESYTYDYNEVCGYQVVDLYRYHPDYDKTLIFHAVFVKEGVPHYVGPAQ